MYKKLKIQNIFFQEGITKPEIEEFVKDAGFGLELEVELLHEYRKQYRNLFNELLFYYEHNKKPIRIINMITLLEALYNNQNILKQYDKYNSSSEPINDIEVLIIELKKIFKENINTVINNILRMFTVFSDYQKPFFGHYHGTHPPTEDEDGNRIHVDPKDYKPSTKGWRIEYDNSIDDEIGCEIITPARSMDSGLTYKQVLRDLPIVAKGLQSLGLSGIDGSTGLHIHISNLDKLNTNNYRKYIYFLNEKYSELAIACYLSQQENIALFKKGLMSRTFSSHSTNFETYLRNKFNTHLSHPDTMLPIGFYDFCYKQIHNLKTNGKNKNELVFPIKSLIYKKQYNEDNFLLNIEQDSHDWLEEILHGTHSQDTSARVYTIEIRSFGGKKAFEAMLDTTKLAQILHLAITQVYPVYKQTVPDENKIIKSVDYYIKKLFISQLNIKLFRLNNLIKDKQNISDSDYKIYAKELNFGQFISQSYKKEIIDFILKNNIEYISSNRKNDKVVIIPMTEKD